MRHDATVKAENPPQDHASLCTPRTKIFYQAETNGLAFFRVELASHDIVLPDGGHKWNAIGRDSGRHEGISRVDEIRMNKIPIRVVRDVAEERTVPLHMHLVPTHMRNLQRRVEGELPDLTGDNVQPLVNAELFALRE